ncbi:MAG: VanW family protein, partial [Myxococcota bacterium]
MRGRTVAFFCFAAFFGLDGSVSGGRSPAAAEGPDVPPEVRVGGETVDLAADPDALIERVSRAWLSERVRVEGIELELERSRYWFGARVDRQRLKQWLLDARNPASALRRVHRQVRGDAPLELPLPRSFEAERLFDFLVELKADIDRRPENARVDTDTKQVLAHRDGLTLDVWATVEEFEVKLLAGERTMRLVVETEAPTMTREDVGEVSLDAVLGTFRTRYNPTEKAEDRTFNLRVAAAKIDGMVVLPGREFDFNALVGERNEANG